MNKAFKIICVMMIIGLTGCATPQQNAILTGAIVGAAVTSIMYSPPHPRPMNCYPVHVVIGYDIFHRPIYQRSTVCR